MPVQRRCLGFGGCVFAGLERTLDIAGQRGQADETEGSRAAF